MINAANRIIWGINTPIKQCEVATLINAFQLLFIGLVTTRVQECDAQLISAAKLGVGHELFCFFTR